MDAFLLDPERSIDLAARWLGQELLPPYEKVLPLYQGSILLAVMGHQAGLDYVKGWMADWKAHGRLGDIEFMVETAGMPETRIFAREVFSTLAIAKAAGIVTPQERATP
jgi:soluble lytic murein transglycosylase-like protein